MKDYGAFVALEGIAGRREGLVHVSAMVIGRRVEHPNDVVHRGEAVKVKVKSVNGNRIELNMKEVDQVSGQDLQPGTGGLGMAPPRSNRFFDDEPTAKVAAAHGGLGDSRRAKKRLTSPERYELMQLRKVGHAVSHMLDDVRFSY